MDTTTKQYLREFIYSMIAYVLTLIPSILLVNYFSDYPLNANIIVVALAPVVPVGFMIFFFLKYLSKIDELQQRIQLLAIGFAAGTTSMLAFSYGFLENIGFPPISLMWVFPVMVMLWGIGLAFISRRYK
ncbi:MAG: hypothetical protein HZB50_12395 [Chloroflexi bacterium]|nr:hypothetical protein [Chloroflexota bacterium]